MGKRGAVKVKRKKSAKRKLVGIRIDIETKSRADLPRTGVHRYVEDPEFEVLLIRFSAIQEIGGRRVLGRIQGLDPNDEAAKGRFLSILTNPELEKHAFNAAFERICLSRWAGMQKGVYLDPENWHCSATRANANGVFGTLDDVARALRSPIAKDPVGKALIKFFSGPIPARSRLTCPCDPNGFHEPDNHPEKFSKFGDYCSQDVATEAAVARLLPDIPRQVQREYEADQRINDRGFLHHRELSEAAVEQVEIAKELTMAKLKKITGLENPNSNVQMSEWLISRDYPMDSLDKAHREEALADPLIPKKVAKVLRLKGEASLSSVTKHKAALNTRCADGRIRGSLQFYGAHTGREAGRGIQPQNLPRDEASQEDQKRLLKGRAGRRAPEIAKGAVRSSIIPSRGSVFVVPDYNAIEARCLGWQAGEKWVEDEFRTGQGKIYEATAEMMFGVSKLDIIAGRSACGECGYCDWCRTRGKGKVSNLALGYAGGAGALVTMGAEREGIDIGNFRELQAEWKKAGSPGKFHEWNRDLHDYPELIRLRDLFRAASPATTSFWKQCAMAFDAASSGKGARFGADLRFSMIRDGKHNKLVLPSGRAIWYRHARSHVDKDRPDHVDRRTFVGKSLGIGHVRTDTHGGKLTENITQAVARDVLFDLILKIEKMTAKGWPGKLVLHVHDEVVLEVREKHADRVLADVEHLMGTPPTWAPGLAVKGVGGIMERYGK